jgi:hypothetical protein
VKTFTKSDKKRPQLAFFFLNRGQIKRFPHGVSKTESEIVFLMTGNAKTDKPNSKSTKTDKPNSKSTKRDKKPAILCVKPQELVSTLVANPRSLFNPFLFSKSL